MTGMGFTLLAALSSLSAFAAAAVQGAQTDKLLSSDGGVGDKFGFAVAVDGDVLVAGAIGQQLDGGAAYVFERSGGVWSEVQKLVPPDGSPVTRFGWSVDVDGNTLAVGRRSDDQDGLFGSGSVYVYVRAGASWSLQQKLRAGDPAVGDEFGHALDLQGDTLVVGSRRDDSETGSVYVFTRSGGAWNQDAKLVASDGQVLDALGFSVAIDGDTVAAGAIGDDDNGDRSGSVYVFVEPPGGWSGTPANPGTETAKLTASDGQALDNFGSDVALDGGTLLVGAHADDDLGVDGGSAYVFTGAGALWNERAKLLADGGSVNGQFGGTVDLEGDVALIGAGNEDNVDPGTGAAYLFVRQAGVWVQQEKLVAPDGALSDNFATSVSLSGGTYAAGAQNDDDHGNNSGSAYVFRLPALHAGGDVLSVAAGGGASFLLSAGPANALLPYLLLGTASGTSPGVPLGGLVVPINPDPYTDFTLLAPGQPPLVDSLGVLDGNGVGQAGLLLPPGSPASLVGLTLDHAYVVIDAQGPVPALAFASNPVSLLFQP